MTGVIVVGIDGSDTAKQAAESARKLALSLGEALHVVTAYDDEGAVVFGTGNDQSVATHMERADKVAHEAAVELSTDDFKVTYSAVRGTPAQALIDQAEKLEARLIVIGNKRMQGLGRVLGSVASNVSRLAPCDVYIAKTVS